MMEPTQELNIRKISSVRSNWVGKSRRSGYVVVPVLLFAAFTGSISVALGHYRAADPAPNGATRTAIAQSAPPVNFYLHGTGPNDNPPTLFLDNSAPTAATAKFKDSSSINFNGGNPWKEVGVWAASPARTPGMLTALNDLHVWLGLKNSDDQGANFDIRAEVYRNGNLLSIGLTKCVTGVIRNPANAKEVTLSFGAFLATVFNGTTDVLSLKILTRIGTDASGARCGSHNSAVGLRLYFDAGSQSSRFNAAILVDNSAPTIASTVTPPPNPAGWNKSSPTVTFICADASSGIDFCTEPITIDAETLTQTVGGTAIDKTGNTATTSVTVKVDKTPPVLSITSPAGGTRLFTSPVTLGGTVADTLSGVASVTCNGAPGIVNGASFSCPVTLTPGANSIIAIATDVAGNTATSSLSLIYTRVPIITIDSPANLGYLNISPTTVNGAVDDPTATVTVNSVQAAVVNGHFSVALPLAEGPNVITASATSSVGAVGTASTQVTLDTTPPHVTITSPPDQFVTSDSSISVAGNVNDIVVGTVNSEQAQVTVNGATAQVANRTFLAVNVPLVIGTNVIQAVGRDRVGNAATTQIVVTRQTSTQPQIRLISGNNQTAAVGAVVAAPLVVAVTDSVGNPVPNKPVIFKVTQNDGMVNVGGAGGAPAPTVIATTDAQGQAQVQWKLGMRAGAGGNSLDAYSVGFSGTAIFTATGTQGPAGKIVVDTGNDQIGAVGQSLAKPLIAVVVDSGNNRLGGVPVTFTVKEGGGAFDGQPSFTVNTDSDGRAAATLTLGLQEGNANNLVDVNFPSNTGFPASFTASGRAAGDPLNTTISGVVLDNSNVPIPGVTIRAVLTNTLNSNSSIVQSVAAVQTNAQGQFSIAQAPVGFVKLLVDGSTAQRPGAYPTLDYDLVTVAGQANTLPMPIYLLALSADNQLCVTPTTGGGTLTVPEAPGFSLTFAPGQVTFPGGSKTGCVSVTVVHGDKVPMVPGFGQQPRFIVTIQPAGAIFSPPAAITLPNVDGLRPRAVTEMYSFDHDIGSFVAIGTGTVSDDGRVIRSNPGVGVLKAGWHCGGDPNQTGSAATCPECKKCVGASCDNDDTANCDDNNQCTSATGTSVGPDKCQGGSCQGKTINFDEHAVTVSEEVSVPSSIVEKIDGALHLIPGLSAITLEEVKGAIEGKVKDCCEKTTGVVTDGIKEVSVSASLKAKVKGLTIFGPPTITKEFDLGFGIVDVDLEVGAKIDGDFSFSASGGRRQDQCKNKDCFFGEVSGGTTVTAKATASAIVCVETFWTTRSCGSIIITPLSFSSPITVSGSVNKPDCGSPLKGSISFGKLKFKLSFGFGITDPPRPTSGSVEAEGFTVSFPPLSISYEKTILDGFTITFP
jgi:hypothetical protein